MYEKELATVKKIVKKAGKLIEKEIDNFEVFTRNRAKEGWEMMLQDLVEQTKDYDSVLGWSIMGEPNPEIYFLEEDSDDFETSGKICPPLGRAPDRDLRGRAATPGPGGADLIPPQW